MQPFVPFRRWVNALVSRAFLPIAVATVFAIVAGSSSAEEQAVPAKPATPAQKVAPVNPLTTLFSALIGGTADSPKPAAVASGPATHARQTEFLVKGHDDKGWLQAFAVDSRGRLLAAVGSRATYGVGVASPTAVTREVQVFSADGQPLEHWTLDFDPQRIAVGPKDEVFVAGSGKIARFDAAGKQLALVDSPHMEAVLGNPDALRESAEQQRKQFISSYQQAMQSIEQQKELLEKRIVTLEEQAKKVAAEAQKAADEKAADDSTKPRAQPTRPVDRSSPQLTALKRQLAQNDAQVKAYRQALEQQENRSVDDIIQEIKQRLQKINAIAVTDDEVFITTGLATGYGFAVWRTDREFQGAKQILANLSGCCGQMDVQVIGGELFIAENTRHRVARYDRDGKPLATFGSRERESAGACFGGCCNPMNVCLGPNGTVLTAESEGFVKAFQIDGTYVGLIGKAQVAGGCKNVSIATAPGGDRVYFYDLEKSRVVVMARDKPSDDAKPEKTASKN